jgi:cytochrome oxidase Cu insertion factor (SCO1/SenC/PrrC family)
VSLRSLRGRPVVLTFLDPHCIDVCPVISAEFVRVEQLLGSAKDQVAMVAINVNQYANSAADVLTFTRTHQLDGLSNFWFLTGSTSQLAKAWKDYGVFVQAPNPSAEVVHTSVAYFIDGSGVVRYVAMPEVVHRADGPSYLPQSSIDTWAKGTAEVSRSLQT